MLMESRKRQRTQGDYEETQFMPQAKRSSTAAQSSEGSRESWESESSSSDSSWVSSPEHAAGSSSSIVGACGPYGSDGPATLIGPGPGPCSPLRFSDQPGPASRGYHYINRILREAHFQSVQNRTRSRDRLPLRDSLDSEVHEN